MKKPGPILPIVLAAALVMVGVGAAALGRTRLAPLRYFPETGHLLTDPFLSYFNDHGGAEMLGYPLTDAYTGPDGALVQTFQNIQLALTVRGVRSSPLNRLLRLSQEQPGGQVAPELAETYNSLGGDAFFGAPLGAAHQENGLLVQDFERARLIRDSDGRVRLADLGAMYLAVFPVAAQGQAEFAIRGTPTPPPAIVASASVEHTAVAQGGEQTIYLLVEDGHGGSVAGARSLAVLRYGSATAEVGMPPTDASGVASARFIAPPAPSGSRVTVRMNVLVGEVFLTVETTYFQWW